MQIGMVKCDFWELESTQKLLWLIFEKCLNVEKYMFSYFCYRWSMTLIDLNPMGLDRVFIYISNKIGITQFGFVPLPELIFKLKDRF